jgi:hypothetical protein
MAIMTRQLGRTGADVTVLGFGAMEVRGGPPGPEIAEEDAGRLLNAVLHLASNIAMAERGPLPADLYDEARKLLPLPEAQ